MRRQILSIAVLVILSAFLPSCGIDSLLNKYPDAEISKTEAGNTLIVTDNFSVVILTKEFMDARSPWVHPVPPQGYWTPKVDQVLAVESKLAEYVAQNGSRFNTGHAPSKEELSTYGRQYFGLTNRQGSFIVGSFVCPQSSEKFDWQNEMIAAVTGGCDCFFHVIYDPEKQEFINIGANDTR
jgi:hypothetical protein